MNIIKGFSIICLGYFLLSSSASMAQSEEAQDNGLENTFRGMIEGSETFQQYKVIPITKINSFEKQLSDTLENYQSQIEQAEISKNNAEQTADSLRSEVQLLTTDLEETQKQVDGILFLGMPMTKSGYNIMFWTIVAILIIGLALVYALFLNSNRVTKQTKVEKERVDNELEELRKTSHEKQVKIKRELQTALNKLEEQNR
ncbi:hypothetical protein JKA74_14575 [Marivirga sp. S37H4]|uniref:tRNA (Guanine-N1)-methyltransferase n=1 Tax=Marivirga aurantiaca TaxID=2802615 RepID=A0A934WZU9_9BACT|nr:hypothetical protein [Marivirga aurantiaca]MBK6266268.1 hypothetical protein [Marivirga aurantiaca]